MANLNSSFIKFCDKVRLSKSKKDNLITSREANRNRIRKHFNEILKQTQPEFFQQGSFSFKTTINPIDGEYDVDDGVYLQNLDDDFLSTLNPVTVHKWIADAVKDATKAKVVDKHSCIRVVYANDYHIDLPIYGVKDDDTFLANTKNNTWVKNHPKGFNEWFYNKLTNSTEQLRRNIICLKAWADFNSYDKITGILLTVLVCNYQISKEDKDDESLFETVKGIISSLQIYRSVYAPVEPFDNLLEKYNSDEIEKIITSFERLKNIAEKAINEKDIEKASNYWISVFGDRFILNDSDDQKEKAYAVPVLTKPAKPWCNI